MHQTEGDKLIQHHKLDQLQGFMVAAFLSNPFMLPASAHVSQNKLFSLSNQHNINKMIK